MRSALSLKTSVCLSCGVRFAAASHCPECGGAALSLRATTDRDRALKQLGRPTWRGRIVLWLTKVGFGFGMVALVVWAAFAILGFGAAVAWAEHVNAFLPCLVAPLWLLLSLAVPVFIGVGGVSILMSIPGLYDRVAVHSPPAGSSPEVVVLEGVVALDRRSLTSPIDHVNCVAFRVVGQLAGFTLDDGEAVPFLLEVDDRTVAIDTDGAVLDADRGWPRERGRATMRAFFERLGLGGIENLPDAAETTVREGEWVTITGRPVRHGGRGYRDEQGPVASLHDVVIAPYVEDEEDRDEEDEEDEEDWNEEDEEDWEEDEEDD